MNQLLRPHRFTRPGYSLLEMFMVLGIIAVLIAMFLPATRSVREAARRTDCQNRLRQWTLGLHQYHDVYGHFPAVAGDERWSSYAAPETAARLNPFPLLLPYVDQNKLVGEIFGRQDQGENGTPVPLPTDASFEPWRTSVDLLHCASARDDSGHPEFGKTDYGFCIGSLVSNIHSPGKRDGAFAPGMRSNLKEDFPDGTHCTLFLGEIGGRNGRSIAGNFATHVPPTVLDDPTQLLAYVERKNDTEMQFREDVKLGPYGRGAFWADAASTNVLFNTVAMPNSPSGAIESAATSDGIFNASSAHPSGVNVACGDGSVHTIIPDGLDPNVWRQLGNRDDGTPTEGW